MQNYIQPGEVLSLTPAADVFSGQGYLFGTALFGVATVDVANGAIGAFRTEGHVLIAKTSALAITRGDLLYWDAANKVVNKTSAGQRCVGVATSNAINPSAFVEMKLGNYSA